MPAKLNYKIDYILLFTIIALIVAGLFAIYTSSYNKDLEQSSNLFIRQIMWSIVAFVFYIGISMLNYQKLGQYSFYIYLSAIVLLLLTLIIGRKVRNVRAWISFGFFNIQPAELAKVVIIIALAKFLSMRVWAVKKIRDLIVPVLIVLLPTALIMLQPDLG